MTVAIPAAIARPVRGISAMECAVRSPTATSIILANLFHSCGACYTDCQFSPPA